MYFFIFTIGVFIGSFLNVLIDRLPNGESPFGGRSHCDKCKKTLKWYDLIPLFSFLALKGKCRYCHTRLSFYYPVVELVTGALFVLVSIVILSEAKDLMGFFSQMSWPQNDKAYVSLFYYLFIVSALIVIFFCDLKYGIIPDKIVFPSILISFSYLFLIHNSLFIIHILAAVGASLFFLALFLITKGRGMGFGDVKFSFLMGLILGFPNIVLALYIAFLTGAILGCILIIWKKKRLSGTKIPFGPFLVFGTIVTLFFGEILIQKISQLL